MFHIDHSQIYQNTFIYSPIQNSETRNSTKAPLPLETHIHYNNL